MRKKIYFLLACFLLSLAVIITMVVSKPKASQEVTFTPLELAWMKEHPVIKVAPDFHFAPYEYYEDGEFHGLGISYVQWIEDRYPLKFEFVAIDTWSGILQALENKEVDLSTCLAATPQREEFLLFTDDYMIIENVILIRDDFEEDFIEEDLPSLNTAVLKDYYIQDVLENKYPGIDLAEYVSVTDALNALSIGEVDILIIDIGQAAFYINDSELSNIDIYDGFELDYKLEMAMGVRKDYKLLRDILNKILTAMTEEEKEAIKKEWIQLDPVNPWIMRVVVVTSILALFSLLVIIAIIIWNRSLNKQVLDKTRIIQEDLATMSLLKGQLIHLIDAVPLPICVSNDQGYIEHLNASYQGLFDMPRDQIYKEKKISLIQTMDDPGLKEVAAYDQVVLDKQERVFLEEVAIKNHLGQEIMYDVIKLPFDLLIKNQHGVLTVLINVSDRLKAKQVLADLNTALEQKVNERTLTIQEKNKALEDSLNQLHETQDKLLASEKIASLSRLVVGIAHSLNTPLGNAILATSYMDNQINRLNKQVVDKNLSQKSLNKFIKDSYQSYEMLEKSLAEASSIIDVLKTYQLTSKDQKKTTVKLSTFVKHILTVENHMNKYPINFNKCQDLTLDVDTVLLEKVLVNIYKNIHEHAFSGLDKDNCLITVTCQRQEDHILLSFRDNGHGIPEDILENVTEPLYSSKRGQGRLGLGLYVTDCIVSTIFDGQLNIRNNDRSGVTINILLDL